MIGFLKQPEFIERIKDSNLVDKLYKSNRFKVFMGIYIGYAAYYLVRKNFSFIMPVLAEHGYTKASLGFAFSANAIAYGLSKFVMGNVSDKSNARVFLPLGLILSAIAALLIGTEAGMYSIWTMFALLFMVGWFQGMGWPPCGRIMTHWFSTKERGTLMAIWNTAHNIGGGLVGPLGLFYLSSFVAEGAATNADQITAYMVFPAVLAIAIAVLTFFMLKDTPQSEGLPPIEEWKKEDYSEAVIQKAKEVEGKKESGWDIFVNYVLNNKVLWLIAIANAFVYFIRYGVLDWAPVYLKDVKGYNLKEVSWAYSAYEWAAIPGTLICGWVSDKFFKGKRSIITVIYMALVLVALLIYWQNTGDKTIDAIALIMIGFLVYGPVMMIGVQALDLAPKTASGTSAGFTGFFGYVFGTAILANIVLGWLVDTWGWNAGFIALLVAGVLSIIFIGLTYPEEKKMTE